MSPQEFQDDSYDSLVWDEVWKKACKNADQNWSKNGIVIQLSTDLDVSEATIWRILDANTKWSSGTRKKIYNYAGYNSIDDYREKKNLGAAQKNADSKMTDATSSAAGEKGFYNIPVRPDYFLGRQELLKKIHERLTNKGGRQNILLLNSIGGMGKTTLMQEYLHLSSSRNYFDRIIVISVNRDLESAFILGADQALDIGVKDILLREEKLRAVVNALSRCKGENLFVVDNINEPDYDDLLKMKSVFDATHWKFLITTRTAPDDFEKLEIDELNLEDAALLFAYHYVADNIDRNDTDALNKFIKEQSKYLPLLLQHAFRHTLLVELLAKTGKKKLLHVYQLLNILKTQDLKNPDLRREITIGPHPKSSFKQEFSKTTLHDYIFCLFDTDYLTRKTGDGSLDFENERKSEMLQFFSVLPAEDILIEDLKKLWSVEPDAENTFEGRLDELKQIGWLQGKHEYIDTRLQHLTYKMHPLVQEVVYDKLKPTVESCRPLIQTLTKILPTLKSQPQKYQAYTKSAVDKLNFLSK